MKKRTVKSPYEPWATLHGELKVPEGVTLRPARTQDYSDIVTMSRECDILDGRDYMADIFPELVNNPDIHIVQVAERDGKVVSMGGFTHIAGSPYMAGFGARSDISIRGTGIYKVLEAATEGATASAWPDVTLSLGKSKHAAYWEQWMRDHPNSNTTIINTLSSIRLFHKEPIDAVRSALHRLESARQRSTGRRIDKLDRASFKKLLEDEETVKRLFPTGTIECGYQVFPAVAASLDAGLMDAGLRTHVFVAVETGSGGDRVTSLSNATMFSCQIGTRYDIAYYPAVVNSPPDDTISEMLDHITHHLTVLVSQHHRFGGMVTSLVNVPQIRGEVTDDQLGRRLRQAAGLDAVVAGSKLTDGQVVHLLTVLKAKL